MTTAGLLWSVLFGAVGAGYAVYGRRQRAWVPGLCGLVLLALPYLLTQTVAMVVVCSLVAAVPFFYRP